LYRDNGKRLFELLLTVPALILLSPLHGILALLIRRRMGSPVLFRQMRPGLQGKPFALLKFRTMNDVRDEQGELLPAVKCTEIWAPAQKSVQSKNGFAFGPRLINKGFGVRKYPRRFS
jgi:lipopolysaccharide/colanic/teichoic acid biosynthesis glycosyltransferase